MYSKIVDVDGVLLTAKAKLADIAALMGAAVIRKVKGKRALYVAFLGFESRVKARFMKFQVRHNAGKSATTFCGQRVFAANSSSIHWSHNFEVCAGYAR